MVTEEVSRFVLDSRCWLVCALDLGFFLGSSPEMKRGGRWDEKGFQLFKFEMNMWKMLVEVWDM